tara:strand:+ start:9289 stop:11697 length:2409 start_codon:yes stop_codon:yes gene_type:complete
MEQGPTLPEEFVTRTESVHPNPHSMKLPQILLFILLLPAVMQAAVLTPKNADFAEGLQSWGHRLDNTGTQTVQLTDGPAPTALKVDINEAPEKPWFSHIRQAVDIKLYPAEQIAITAMMRSADHCTVSLTLQSTRPPFSPFLSKRIKLTPEWQKVTVKGSLQQPLGAGQSQINVTLGFGTGTLEMTNFRIELPEREDLDSVPDSFLELAWDENDLPLVDVQAYPIPDNGKLPDQEYRSIVEGVEGLNLQGKRFGEVETVAISGQHFDKAVRLTTNQDTPKPYSIQLKEPLLNSVEKGSTLVALFSFRVLKPNPETNYAASQFSLEKSGGKYERLISWGIISDDQNWHHYFIPFKADFEVLAGASQIVFRGGYGPQTIEIGGVSLINLGKGVNPKNLPFTPMGYVGAEPDSPWREEALARIEKIRKGEFTLTLTNAKGEPVPGARVTGALIDHAYGFGSALGAPILLPGSRKYNQDFGKTAAEMFNAGSLENAMKWKRSTLPGNEEQIEEGLRWMEEQGWQIRGHALVWPSWRYNNAEIKKLQDDPQALQEAILDRITTTTKKYAGRIQDWDVINEPYTNHTFMDLIGDNAMATWMEAAREGDPNSNLFINDFDIVTRPGSGNPKIDYYMELIERFQKNGTPLDGMGLQSHFVGSLTPIPHVYGIIDQFAQKGLTVQLTELTVNIPDEQTQADYVRDFITIAFSHPATNMVQTWGFWEGYMWEPEAALFRKDWSPKPSALSFKQLVQETFSTEVEGETNDKGNLSFRGFFGTYTLTAEVDGEPTTFTATFGPGALSAEIQEAE